MNISDSLDQYADICRDAINNASAKLNKSFEKFRKYVRPLRGRLLSVPLLRRHAAIGYDAM